MATDTPNALFLYPCHGVSRGFDLCAPHSHGAERSGAARGLGEPVLPTHPVISPPIPITPRAAPARTTLSRTPTIGGNGDSPEQGGEGGAAADDRWRVGAAAEGSGMGVKANTDVRHNYGSATFARDTCVEQVLDLR
jgi:hypothetical protein